MIRIKYPNCNDWVASDLARKQDRVIAMSYLQPTQLSPVTTWPAGPHYHKLCALYPQFVPSHTDVSSLGINHPQLFGTVKAGVGFLITGKYYQNIMFGLIQTIRNWSPRLPANFSGKPWFFKKNCGRVLITTLNYSMKTLKITIQIKNTAALIVTSRLLQFVQSSTASLNQILHSKVSILSLSYLERIVLVQLIIIL